MTRSPDSDSDSDSDSVDALRERLARAEADLAERERELTATKAELADQKKLVRILFDENPNGVSIIDSSFALSMNATSKAMFGNDDFDTPGQMTTLVEGGYGLFRADKVTPVDVTDSPLARAAMQGQVTKDELFFVRTPRAPVGMWLNVDARPIEGYGSIAIFRDVTDKKRLEDEVAAGMVERNQLVEQLRAAIDELSVPVLEVWKDVIAAPLVGVLDSQRCARMTEKVLEEVVRRKARFAIVDLTGIGVIDTATADYIARTIQSIRLLGAEGIVTGLQPQVAQTLIGLDATFQGFRTEPTLRRAIEYCLGRVHRER